MNTSGSQVRQADIWRVFYSFSPQDVALRDKLGAHLAPLVQKHKMSEWHLRVITPGTDWASTISERLDSAHLLLLLLSVDYLSSDYCFGAEIDRALDRLNRNEVRVLPILLRSCLWQESRFSELQILPRDGKPIALSSSVDEALHAVASEIREIVSTPPPISKSTVNPASATSDSNPALGLVAQQFHSYARLYERTRQRMTSSAARTGRMEQIVVRMRTLAPVASPLLPDLANSLSPGDRLAAVVILQFFAVPEFHLFLLQMVESDQSFIGYQALLALHFAVEAMEPQAYPELSRLLHQAQLALDRNGVAADSDRRIILAASKKALQVAHALFVGSPAEATRDAGKGQGSTPEGGDAAPDGRR